MKERKGPPGCHLVSRGVLVGNEGRDRVKGGCGRDGVVWEGEFSQHLECTSEYY